MGGGVCLVSFKCSAGLKGLGPTEEAGGIPEYPSGGKTCLKVIERWFDWFWKH